MIREITEETVEIEILWHVDPLLGTDREISKYTTTVAK
jgi:hypothetical protein